ncbi:response regulator [Methylobrevis albus]|uniref:Winged helix-turn-helix domain-containing protein n=1 Tax=Methylobrevis albus TaxID=2793297 RepID=A0A931HZS1_9HYPH|nr:response regulator [Methylobrevis albus]MBH0237737.1 winged helix-turn-helix domain-containing protein [Methylobrevis albus]
MKILVVEDDRDTADYITAGLKQQGHVVDVARSGRDGLFLAAGEGYDLVVLDRMLPEVDGLKILRTLRGAGDATPVLLLTTMGSLDDRVEGLEAGADDYLVKPFAFAELNARVNALSRRAARPVRESLLKVHDLEVDCLKRTVTRAGRLIELQNQEFRLLEYLMRHPGEVVTRTMLLENVWDFHFDPKTNIVETHMSRLRGKVDRGFDAELIHTVRGAGYVLRAPQ